MRAGLVAAALALAACSEAQVEPDRTAVLLDDLRVIALALEQYEADHGHPPDSLDVLTRPDPEGRHYLPGGTPMIHDPWGRRYEYELTSDGTPRVFSLGRDGRPGGTGADADVGLDSLGN
jgi:general secretion pathway protein G